MKPETNKKKRSKRRGQALLASFGVLALLSVAAVSYVDHSTQTLREASHNQHDVTTTHLAESGVQRVLRDLWKPFKQDQHFINFDTSVGNASQSSPVHNRTQKVAGVGRYAAGVVAVTNVDPYTRLITIRSVGWLDHDNDRAVDEGEPRKVVDVTARFELQRSRVFDYTYFANNYGWMYGFNENNLIINGDVRANGNFEFTGGSPRINGTIVGSHNAKLTPAALGLINHAPTKWSTSTYNGQHNGNNNADNQNRWRQAYDPAKHGALGSAEFEKWRDLVFFSDGQLVNNKLFGATLSDARGHRAWNRLSGGQDPTYSTLDTTPTEEVVMPDLSNLSHYQNLSASYVDDKPTRGGVANPHYGEGAWLEVWNSSTNSYQRISANGNIAGSAVLVGTYNHPIRIHGPVTVTQDIAIKGYVEGQGTIYTGRNTHIVGSIRYKNPPNFKGNNPQAVEDSVEQADMLGLAARASIIMGNPVQFRNPYPLKYMSPPFTKGRYDEDGNFVPPFNAYETDSTGRMKYQSVISDSVINSISEGINQVDGILYTNFTGGGQLGMGGGGITFNGTLITKDESMVIYSLPMRMNYDNRIKERAVDDKPLIDLQLPRSPAMLRSTWQQRGFGRTAITIEEAVGDGTGGDGDNDDSDYGDENP